MPSELCTSAEAAAVAADPQRLTTLRRLMLLDTPSSESFDRLTRLAARVLRAPMAVLTLVDSDRQFFKSAVGLPATWASARQTPLEYSICQYAVASGTRLVVSDAHEVPQLVHHPTVTELGVVAYAGEPLVLRDGSAVGTLCVADVAPRQWTDDDLASLADLADAVLREIQVHRLERAFARRKEWAGVAGARLRF
jgi:GAF domain-containing protein